MKGFTAGSAAMHGVMVAELIALGFTGNRASSTGDDGVMRMIEVRRWGDPQKVIENLGTWNMDSARVHCVPIVSCGWHLVIGHEETSAESPVVPEEIESIRRRVARISRADKLYHRPQTGARGKYSLETTWSPWCCMGTWFGAVRPIRCSAAGGTKSDEAGPPGYPCEGYLNRMKRETRSRRGWRTGTRR